METIGIIYKLKSPECKVYIGKTIQKLKVRYKQHSDKRSSCRLLKGAIERFGIDAFEKEVLWKGPSSILGEMEAKYIKDYNSLDPHGYNLRSGGGKSERISDQSRNLMITKQREQTLKRNGLLGSVIKDKNTWYLKASINGKKITVAKNKDENVIRSEQIKYTENPDNYKIVEPVKRRKNGEGTIVKRGTKYKALYNNTYIGSFETYDNANEAIKYFVSSVV